MRTTITPSILSLLTLCLVLAKAASAQVPTPEAFLEGYRQNFTPHHRLVEYYKAVDAASDRVQIEQYGQTYEGRPLIVAYVSAPENLARLEELRQTHLRQTGFTNGQPNNQPTPQPNNQPTPQPNNQPTPQPNNQSPSLAVVWLSFSVHGNEVAGSEASPQVLYDLATGTTSLAGGILTGDSLTRYLRNTIVILDPSLNPDGYTRYTDDVRRRQTTFLQPDRSAWEHVEAWPGGRTNHYLFDLNRDWAWATQQETQQRLRLYQRWQPHVHADLHEMGADDTYYFAPAAEPFHKYVSDHQRRFQTQIGRNHAQIFDANGWLYFTKEVFDLLYPSYGDTYPTFNGAIGMTYEQAGSGRAGRAYLREEGDTLTIDDRLTHHHATALSTIAVASRNAATLTREISDYRRKAADSPKGGVEAYVFPASENSPARLQSLATILQRHGIEIGSPGTRKLSYTGRGYDGKSYRGDGATGDLIVSTRQVQGTLLQVLLEPENEVPDSLTYDITAWSLPSVLGLKGYAVTQAVGGLSPYATATASTSAKAAPSFGYALPIDGFSAWTTLAPLLHDGLILRYSRLDTKSGTETLAAGSAFVLARDQRPGMYESVYARLLGMGLSPKPIASGFSDGGFDLGSESVRRVEAPTVVLVQDDELDVNAFGHVWHLFEQRLEYPIRPVPWSRIDATALSDVDVMIVTDGLDQPDERKAEIIEAWVRAGGRLILMEGAAEAFAGTDAFSLKMKERGARLEIAGEGPDPMQPYAERERAGASDNTPGALVTAQVDVTHPIGLGLPKEMAMVRVGNRSWAYFGSEGHNVIGIREKPQVRGFVGSEVLGQLDETLALGVQPMGRGEVVYAADNLAYRGFWELGMQVLANAVFYR